jgi:hypothetical protein
MELLDGCAASTNGSAATAAVAPAAVGGMADSGDAAAAIDAESAVYLAANADAMYHILLDHHLTSAWLTPSVPPPHSYFPALTSLLRGELGGALATLRAAAAPVGVTEMRRAWELSESLDAFEAGVDVDPLRQVRPLSAACCVLWTAAVLRACLPPSRGALSAVQVMLARWLEGAVLFCGRAVGADGEMDAAADEEARFLAWAQQQATRTDAASRPAAAAAAPGVGPGDDADTIGGVPAAELDAAFEIALGAAPRCNCNTTCCGRWSLQPTGTPSGRAARTITCVDACCFRRAGLAPAGDASSGDEEGASDDGDSRGRRPLSDGRPEGASGHLEEDGVKPPPPAHAALQAWRDSALQWSCHLYAFAAPNTRALDTLVDLAPLYEAGAGVGYWAALLRGRGADVVAGDSCPTARAEEADERVNDYHGRIPPWTDVQKADAAATSDAGCAAHRLLHRRERIGATSAAMHLNPERQEYGLGLPETSGSGQPAMRWVAEPIAQLQLPALTTRRASCIGSERSSSATRRQCPIWRSPPCAATAAAA